MRPSCVYHYSSSQTATLLILKCPTKQSPKKVPTRGDRKEKTLLAFHSPCPPRHPSDPLSVDVICPRMSDGAAGNSLLAQ
ncbi:hypothetical protein CEXT_401441 [Caerostris extrusa]|uniref:Uncharacterized protein n=1 Tax=Caerostris extrusa TaxID=172846 RepID=A0AAV4NIY0_CAEEX|nr:hypothetical protein CEXT_401441 [Caerostris extrusa]